MKKISIIIPVYNSEKYLDRCLNSIINQSLREIEIICVNDGSTDSSLEILKKYKEIDNRIIIINKKNGGSSSARNEALNIANGEYCLNIDSDDWIEQEYLKQIYIKAKKENLDMLITDIIFDYGEKKQKIVLKDLVIEDNQTLNGIEYLRRFFKDNFYGYSCNKLIKKEYYDKYAIRYNEKIFLYEDVEVITKLAFNMRRIGKLNKAFYHYIRGENNNSNKLKFKNYLDVEKCFAELEKYFGENFQKIIFTRKINNLLLNLLSTDYIKNEEYFFKRNELLNIIKERKKELDKDIIKAKNIKLYLFFNNIFIFEGIKRIVIMKNKIIRLIKKYK